MSDKTSSEKPSDTTTPEKSPSAPALRVVRGNPSDEDVAVVVAVLAGAGGESGGGESREPLNMWGRPADRLRSTDPLAPSVFLNVAARY